MRVTARAVADLRTKTDAVRYNEVDRLRMR